MPKNSASSAKKLCDLCGKTLTYLFCNLPLPHHPQHHHRTNRSNPVVDKIPRVKRTPEKVPQHLNLRHLHHKRKPEPLHNLKHARHPRRHKNRHPYSHPRKNNGETKASEDHVEDPPDLIVYDKLIIARIHLGIDPADEYKRHDAHLKRQPVITVHKRHKPCRES